MRFAGRRFVPSLFAVILTMLGVAVFVRLGLWQLDRAEEKRSISERYAAGEHSTLELTAATLATIPQYQHVRAHGRFDSSRQILLDNMPSQHGQPGYRVVTPFEIDGGVLLVDRGWVSMGATRDALPPINIDNDMRSVAGRYESLPRAGIAVEAPAGSSWPRVMNYPQQQDIETALGRDVLPGLVLLDANQPDGYERAWQTRFRFGPDRHVAYAVQWFALAGAAIVIFLIVSFRRDRTS